MSPFDRAWTVLKGEYYHPSIQAHREIASQMPGNTMFPAPTEEEEEEVMQDIPKPSFKQGSWHHVPGVGITNQNFITRNYGTLTERMPRPIVPPDPNSFTGTRKEKYSPNYERAAMNAKNEIDAFNDYNRRSAGKNPMFQRSMPFPSIETFRLAGQRMSQEDYEREKMIYERRNRR